MVRKRCRAAMWKLVLPFPLAGLLLFGAYLGTRSARDGDAVAPVPTAAGQRAESAPAGEPGRLAQAERETTGQAWAPPAGSEPAEELTVKQPEPSEAAPEVRTETAGAQATAMPPPTTTERMPSSSPAPEKVSPSSEGMLGVSLPPPAAASKPTPAPADIIPMVPAPEPREARDVSRPPVRQAPDQTWTLGSVRAVRFDAGYYYGRGLSARRLAERLTDDWAEQGVNLVYFYAYNRVYGARYHTRLAGNVMEDYGRQDLLGEMLKAAHRRGIKVVAWLNGVQHKQIWEAHPEWRQKTRDGSDYKPDRDSYLLCVRNPEVMKWWLGFVDDLLTRYPDLDGIDLAEFQIDLWGDNTCYCEHCRGQFAEAHPGKPAPGSEWRKFRAEGLTRLLAGTTRLAQGYGKESHVTTVFTAASSGKLMTSKQVRDATGFDLEGVLGARWRPEVVQAELIWQQWAAAYGDQRTFTAEWTREAVCAAKKMVGSRARLIAHVEVTDFGCGGLDGAELAHTIAAAVQGQPYGVDIYDSYQLEKTDRASGYLQTAWLGFAD